jgi:hypothetical protein
MTTIEMLRKKIARVQTDLAEVSAALEELARSAGGSEPMAPPRPMAALPLDETKFTDPQTALRALDAAFEQMGLDVTQPALTPEEVQELMLREGVRPEERILSRGIIEARDE